MVRDIAFASICEHHLLPFIGRAHVAYIPNTEGTHHRGVSKLARLVDGHARRLQVQERLTTEIADSMERVLQPRGTLVVLEAEHLCMTIRGVRKPGALTITSAVRGLFLQRRRAPAPRRWPLSATAAEASSPRLRHRRISFFVGPPGALSGCRLRRDEHPRHGRRST